MGHKSQALPFLHLWCARGHTASNAAINRRARATKKREAMGSRPVQSLYAEHVPQLEGCKSPLQL